MSPTLVILLVGSFVAASCALVGSFLVLRRMALIGDAISHAVLPGIVLAFLLTGTRAALPMVIGAGLLGVLTVALVELFTRSERLREDASIGVTFPALFAIGVILVARYADSVDLDLDCVLYGEIAYAPWDTLTWGGRSLGAKALWVTGGTLLFDLALVLLLYKELKLAAFDARLAAALGFAPALSHYLLMSAVSVTVVGAFESVGAILVVAMLIVPPAAAHLLTERLSTMLAVAVALGVGAALGGYAVARALDVSIAGAMAAVAGLEFLLAFLFAPAHGLISRVARRRRLAAALARGVPLAALLLLAATPAARASDGVRPLSTDRPDTTESPYSVPHGMWQVEGSLADWTRSGDERRVVLLPTNLKYGLTPRGDLQVVLAARVRESANGRVVAEGMPDVLVRYKHNLFGNDDGRAALALMPWLSLPTGADEVTADEVQGGLSVPFAYALTERLGLGLMAELDRLHDPGAGEYGTLFVHTAALGAELTPRWGGFLEYAGFATEGLGLTYVSFLDAGVTYGLGEDAQFDAGVRVGLTGAAENLALFVGYAVRGGSPR